MRFLVGLLAALGSLFAQEPKTQPLNTAVITFSQTYYVPAVTSPDILPGSYKNLKATIVDAEPKEKSVAQNPKPTPPPPAPPAPVITPPPTPPLAAAIVAPIVTPPAPVGDPYLANPEPITNWYRNATFIGNTINSDNAIPDITFDREFWRMEVLAYWAPGDLSKPQLEKDYFKLEVYEKVTDKLVYTITSGTDETMHRFQSFKKPGTYYFKLYLKNPSQYEVTFTISPKMAQY